ncbi:hypothetical protein MMPV_007227 [Pyropia vietnamensis]
MPRRSGLPAAAALAVFLTLTAASRAAAEVANATPSPSPSLPPKRPTLASQRAAYDAADYVVTDMGALPGKATPGGGTVRVAALGSHPVLGLPDLDTAAGLVTLPPGAVNPPHLHPRAAETMAVTAGTLEVYIIDSDSATPPDRRVVRHTLRPRGVAFLPRSLLHGQRCVGEEVCSFFAVLSSADPGVHAAAHRLCDAPTADVAAVLGVDAAAVAAVCGGGGEAPPRKRRYPNLGKRGGYKEET